MKRLIIGIFALVLFCGQGFAALAPVTSSIGTDDVNEINRMNPNATKTFLGTRLYGVLQKGSTTYGASDNIINAGVGGMCNGNYATPTTKTFVKTTGASRGGAYCLGNGLEAGQTLTIVLATDGGRDLVVTPLTSAGWSTATFSDAKDSAMLMWDGVQWVVAGNNGATIN